MSEKAYEKQLKQIDSYKEFKAKLGYSFSKRVPLASLHADAPNFMVLPISRHNQANLAMIDTERGRDNEVFENVSDTEVEVNENLYEGVSFHGSSRRSKNSGKEDSVLENEFVIEKEERLSESANEKMYDLEKLQVYGPEILKDEKEASLVVADGKEVSNVCEIGEEGTKAVEGVDQESTDLAENV